MGQQADAIVEHSLLNCNPEYVPNGVAIIRGNPTFSGKNFASLGCPVLDHLAADGACLTGGQMTVVAVGQIDTDFPWCPFYILNSSCAGIVEGFWPLGVNSLTGSDTISPMNL